MMDESHLTYKEVVDSLRNQLTAAKGEIERLKATPKTSIAPEDYYELESSLVAARGEVDGLRGQIGAVFQRAEIAEAKVDKLRKQCNEQINLLDLRDGPPVYSAVLERAEKAEAEVEKLRGAIQSVVDRAKTPGHGWIGYSTLEQALADTEEK